MGTSLVENISDTIDEDHPHAYGDKMMKILFSEHNRGSSPRVWGQVKKAIEEKTPGGIIPTRMGTSYCCVSFEYVLEDHPHAYGDK